MKGVKALALFLAIILLILGLFFIGAAFADKTRMVSRLITGGIIIAISIVMLLLSRMKTEQVNVSHTYHQHVDLTGDVDIEQMKCSNCGGTLSEQNLKVEAGAVMVSCPYCKTSYQLKEAPKW